MLYIQKSWPAKNSFSFDDEISRLSLSSDGSDKRLLVSMLTEIMMKPTNRSKRRYIHVDANPWKWLKGELSDVENLELYIHPDYKLPPGAFSYMRRLNRVRFIGFEQHVSDDIDVQTGSDNIDIQTGSSIVDGERLFFCCSSLTTIPDNSFPRLVSGKEMFYECLALQHIGENNFQKVVDGSLMFGHCESLRSTPNTFGKLTNGAGMFYVCRSLTDIRVDSFPSLVNGAGMFSFCEKLSDISGIAFPKLECGYNMFGCTSLETIEVSNFPEVTDGRSMFTSTPVLSHAQSVVKLNMTYPNSTNEQDSVR